MRDRTCIINLEKNTYSALKYKQYDNNIPIVFTIIDGSQEVDLSGYAVGAFFQRKDGNIYEKNTIVNGSTVTVTIDNNITALKGKVNLELVFVYNDITVTSFNISIEVEKTIDKNQTLEADPQWDVIRDLLTAGTLTNPIDDNLIRTDKAWSSRKVDSKFVEVDSINQIAVNFLDRGGMAEPNFNNTPVLQALINELYSLGGGTIYLPTGEYFFERNGNTVDYCVILMPNVSIIGAGIGKTILKCGTSTDTGLYSLFFNCDLDVLKCNMTFRDFTVDMQAMTLPEGGGYSHLGKAFYTQNMYNCVFRDLELIGTPSTALGIDFLDKVTIDNVDCTNCGRLWTKTVVNSAGVTIEGPGGAGIGIGTGYKSTENVKVINCICTDCGHYGIFFEHQSIFDYESFQNISKGVIIANNIVTGSRGYGIGIRGGKNYTISNNQIYGCNWDGIHIDSGENGAAYEQLLLENINIVGNVSGENKYDGINIKGNARCRKISIKNNLCYSNTNYGIGIGSREVAQRLQEHITMKDNDIIGNGGGIFIQDNSSMYNVVAENNVYSGNDHLSGKMKLISSGYIKAPTKILDGYTNHFIMHLKVPSGATEKNALLSNRDETYAAAALVKGFSLLIDTEYKIEFTYVDSNGGTKYSLVSATSIPTDTKIYLKVDIINEAISYSTDGDSYTQLEFDGDLSAAFSWTFDNLVNSEHTIGREWSGQYGFSKYSKNLVIYSLYSMDASTAEYFFTPTAPGINKQVCDLNNSGRSLSLERYVVSYLNEPK